MLVIMHVGRPTDMKKKAFMCCVKLFPERFDKHTFIPHIREATQMEVSIPPKS